MSSNEALPRPKPETLAWRHSTFSEPWNWPNTTRLRSGSGWLGWRIRREPPRNVWNVHWPNHQATRSRRGPWIGRDIWPRTNLRHWTSSRSNRRSIEHSIFQKMRILRWTTQNTIKATRQQNAIKSAPMRKSSPPNKPTSVHPRFKTSHASNTNLRSNTHHRSNTKFVTNRSQSSRTPHLGGASRQCRLSQTVRAAPMTWRN